MSELQDHTTTQAPRSRKKWRVILLLIFMLAVSLIAWLFDHSTIFVPIALVLLPMSIDFLRPNRVTAILTKVAALACGVIGAIMIGYDSTALLEYGRNGIYLLDNSRSIESFGFLNAFFIGICSWHWLGKTNPSDQATLLKNRRVMLNVGVTFVLFASLGLGLEKRSWRLGGHRDHIKALAMTPDTKTLASASKDKTIKLWDVSSGRLLRTLALKSKPTALAISRDGRLLAVGLCPLPATSKFPLPQLPAAALYEVATGKQLHTFLSPAYAAGPTTQLAFNGDGTNLAVGSAQGYIRLWNTATGALLMNYCLTTKPELKGKCMPIDFLALAPDNRIICFAANQLMVVTSQPKKATGVAVIKGYTPLALRADGAIIAVKGQRESRESWPPLTGPTVAVGVNGKELGRIIGPSEYLLERGKLLVSFSTNGQVVAAGVERDVHQTQIGVWHKSAVTPDFTVSTYSRRFSGEYLSDILLSPDGRLLIAGVQDKRALRAWDARTGKYLFSFPNDPIERMIHY